MRKSYVAILFILLSTTLVALFAVSTDTSDPMAFIMNTFALSSVLSGIALWVSEYLVRVVEIYTETARGFRELIESMDGVGESK